MTGAQHSRHNKDKAAERNTDSTVWLDPQEAAEISQANSRSGVRRLLKDGHM
jgi:ribosomal protein L19E